jgi:hypothetical protein
MTTARRVLTGLLTLLLMSLLLPVSPASASVVTLGKRCEGARAVRCAWVNHDTTNNRVRGYGSVTDTTSGPDAVRAYVELYRMGGDGWVIASASSDARSDYDYVQNYTGLVTCRDGDMFKARIRWEWNGTDYGSMDSYTADVHYC